MWCGSEFGSESEKFSEVRSSFVCLFFPLCSEFSQKMELKMTWLSQVREKVQTAPPYPEEDLGHPAI